MRRSPLIVSLVVALAGCGSSGRRSGTNPLPQGSSPPSTEQQPATTAPLIDFDVQPGEEHMVVYAPALAAGETGYLDVFTPPSGTPRPRPAILAIHGGAWRKGSKEQVREVARRFCREGYVVFAPDYGLGPRTRWPGQLQDVQRALRWVRANAARYSLDPARIGAWGPSAGGHLSTCLALEDDPLDASAPFAGRVKAAVDVFGPADLTIVGGMAPDEDGILRDLLGAPRSGLTVAQLLSASTVSFARRDASVLVVHGTADVFVSIQNSLRLHEALVRAGADASMVTVPNGRHDGSTYDDPRAWTEIRSFLKARLH